MVKRKLLACSNPTTPRASNVDATFTEAAVGVDGGTWTMAVATGVGEPDTWGGLPGSAQPAPKDSPNARTSAHREIPISTNQYKRPCQEPSRTRNAHCLAFA